MSADIYAIRRRNLESLVEQSAGATPLAKRLGMTAGWVSALLHNHRKITEKTARKFEQALQLPERWLDTAHSGIPESGVDQTLLRASAHPCLRLLTPAVDWGWVPNCPQSRRPTWS